MFYPAARDHFRRADRSATEVILRLLILAVGEVPAIENRVTNAFPSRAGELVSPFVSSGGPNLRPASAFAAGEFAELLFQLVAELTPETLVDRAAKLPALGSPGRPGFRAFHGTRAGHQEKESDENEREWEMTDHTLILSDEYLKT